MILIKLHDEKSDSRTAVHFSRSILCNDVNNVGMGTIPIPSIDTVDTCELEVSIDTLTKYR